MKKITEITAKALREKKWKKLWNSEVLWWLTTRDYYLHNNLIAMYNPLRKTLWISDADWKTQTTKERLNWILQEFKIGHIFQHKGKWYLSTVKDWIYEWTWEKEFILDFDQL